MNFGDLEARIKLPPRRASGTATQQRTVIDTVSGVSLTANVFPGFSGVTIPVLGCYVSWLADTDVYIHWDPIGDTAAASSTISVFLPAGVVWDLWHTPNCNDSFSVIQKTAGGHIARWKSAP
jgi:hypothetical protein